MRQLKVSANLLALSLPILTQRGNSIPVMVISDEHIEPQVAHDLRDRGIVIAAHKEASGGLVYEHATASIAKISEHIPTVNVASVSWIPKEKHNNAGSNRSYQSSKSKKKRRKEQNASRKNNRI